MSLIEAYVTELGDALRGPRSLKTDMLAEARDGLLDAAEAYERGGLDAADAQRRAIADFGPVSVVAPGYQTELGLSQSRRAALLISLCLALQPLVWRGILPLAGHPDRSGGAAYDVVNLLVEAVGSVSIVTGMILVLALGQGTRFLRAPGRLVRAVGVFALVVTAVFGVLGTLMSVFSAGGHSFGGLPMLAVLLYLPLLHVAFAARRCLRAAA